MKFGIRDARFFFTSIAFLFVLTLNAAQSATAERIPRNPILPALSSDLSPLVQPQVKALTAKAQAKDSVRVIVGLRGNYQPEGRLGNAQAIQTQRNAISQAQNALLNQMTHLNVQAIKKFAFIPHLVVEADAAALVALAFNPNVTSIEEDQPRRPSLMVSVPLIGAPSAWAKGYTGAGQVVAILDTGIDKTHPFLSGKVVSEACYSTTNPVDTATSLCPGGVAQSTDPGSGLYCTVVGICIHGTHVAGIAAGRDNGSIGFSGVAKDANLIAIQIFSYFSDCACIGAYDSDILSGMERVQTLSSSYNIAAVNLSLGGETYTTQAACDAAYPAYKDAIANLSSLNIATVIASGNDYSSNAIETPACVSGAISVGSTQDGSGGTSVDTVSSFSDSSSFLSLLAPGEYIYSSIPGGGFRTLSGTSMATPHAAGAWAVLKSAQPSATVDQILAALGATGQSVTDGRNGITKPRIQVDRAANFLTATNIYYFPFLSK
jgi:subtilisin